MKSPLKEQKKKKSGLGFGRFLFYIIFFGLLCVGGLVYWAQAPVLTEGKPIEFTVKPGSGAQAVARQLADVGAPINPTLFSMMARASGQSGKIKAGPYELKPGVSPWNLLGKLIRGEIAQSSLTIIEGWTFKQMRQAIGAHPFLRHDAAQLSDAQLLAKIGVKDFKHPEGLFFPDTYMFAKGSSDVLVFKQAHANLIKRLSELWEKRDPASPYKSPYEALIMASIIEKETGKKAERGMIASVFVNRLRMGMMLQTDPTVIYGIGDKFDGNIRRRDLKKDTPYNTYTRRGLPPTPIALPGMQSLSAAMNPEKSDALYFVARGDGSSQFSSNLRDHNNAVIQYQLKGRVKQNSK
ncbi:MAG: endolytic transglycosylase MltG [Oxalobacter sp.]|nr:MAG: endolytic transglycosylase MltG [Oxalobacter sp.]